MSNSRWMKASAARRLFIAVAAGLLALTTAACSSVTDGSGQHAAATSESSASSESSAAGTDVSAPQKPAGSMTASDGSFTYELPTGYTDGTGQMPNTVAAAYDPSVSPLPTSILVTPMPSGGLTLQELADEGAAQIESSIGATVTIVDGFPLSDIDGEDLLAFTTDEYQTQGETVSSAGVLTKRDDTVYVFTVNTMADLKQDAADALVELVSSVVWA